MWLGNKFIVIISEPDYLEKLISNKDCWEKDTIYDVLKPYVGEGLITASAEKWKKNRKLLNPTFKQKILNGFVPVFCKYSTILVDILEKGEENSNFNINQKFMASTLDTTCDPIMKVSVKKVSTRRMLDRVQRLACVCITGAMRTCPTRALEIITDLTPLHLVIDRVAHEAILRLSKEGTGNERIKSQRVWSSLNDYISSANLPSDLMIKKAVMGVRVDAQISSNTFGDWLDRLMEFCSLRITRFIYRPDFIFYLIHGKAFAYALGNLTTFTKTVFERQKQIFNQEMAVMQEGTHLEDEEQKYPTFLKLLLEVSYNGGQLSDQEIQEEINTFIAAATDTSATTLSYCCLLLAMHPEYQQKIYEEAVGILGEDRDVTPSDIPKFQFLDMCLKETLRVFPVIPFVMRIASADIELDNFVIPEGTSMIYSIFTLHRSPKYWKDPLKFNPYRFSPEESAKMHPYSYMPFMKGPRTCIGQKYSFMVMKVMLTKVIRRFQFETEYKSVEEVELKLNLAIRPKNGFKLTLKRRI
ncbi:cytochrome P450 4C1-like [Coccinella septempunctata]|uniref:cytochrome P450 4C1-like n=1 Tax=Coccinella septempunctata TaxID=41139 RepID=UPI001D07BBD2|nr:cytochrome P450 4C1-like [Coccinella septempunctata]